MKDIHNHPLFTDISPEEEVSVQGGVVPPSVISLVNQLVRGFPPNRFDPSSQREIMNWLSKDGNGFIVGDRPGIFEDKHRAGKIPADLPNGWTWGIFEGGKVVSGGRIGFWRQI